MFLTDDFKPIPPRYPEFSKRLKAARKARRISQSEMADLIGIDWCHYSKFDNGHEFPPLDILAKINRVLFA